ncbi:hypothetical protein DRO53_02050 [Candidatus Bathyarchaeota archaeon]|nr:MAG: hypothetical protein DRO53_02050 [Candidatus Bathyarchaeota archaeon]
MARRKSAKEKMLTLKEPKVVEDPRGRGKMLIPTPLLLAGLIRRIPRGKLATIAQLREKLARDFKADFTCPMTTGIFLRIIAEAAEEELKEGKEKVTPYWRVLRRDGSLNEKFPGGVRLQAERLKQEGHILLPGKIPKVKDYVKALVRF